MSFEEDFAFRKKLETAANPYQLIREVMKDARALSASCGEKILHSEAITHVIHGTKPIPQYIEDFQEEYEASYLKELFCYIDDKEIQDAVYDSFYESKAKGNLIFLYNRIQNPDKQARVRVLTRMLWHQLILEQE